MSGVRLRRHALQASTFRPVLSVEVLCANVLCAVCGGTLSGVRPRKHALQASTFRPVLSVEVLCAEALSAVGGGT